MGKGLVAVSTSIQLFPDFQPLIVGDFVMEETSYLRGRKNSFVRYEEE